MKKFYNLRASTKQRIKCFAQGHNTVPLVELKPATPQSHVQHSTTEQLGSMQNYSTVQSIYNASLRSTGMDNVIHVCESCYKGTILHRNYRKMTIS